MGIRKERLDADDKKAQANRVGHEGIAAIAQHEQRGKGGGCDMQEHAKMQIPDISKARLSAPAIQNIPQQQVQLLFGPMPTSETEWSQMGALPQQLHGQQLQQQANNLLQHEVELLCLI